MIEIHDKDGRVSHYVATDDISAIAVAQASSQWHGVRCYVRLGNNEVIECGDSAGDLLAKIKAFEGKSSALPEILVMLEKINANLLTAYAGIDGVRGDLDGLSDLLSNLDRNTR